MEDFIRTFNSFLILISTISFLLSAFRDLVRLRYGQPLRSSPGWNKLVLKTCSVVTIFVWIAVQNIGWHGPCPSDAFLSLVLRFPQNLRQGLRLYELRECLRWFSRWFEAMCAVLKNTLRDNFVGSFLYKIASDRNKLNIHFTYVRGCFKVWNFWLLHFFIFGGLNMIFEEFIFSPSTTHNQ